MGVGQNRLSLQCHRSGERLALASHAGGFSKARHQRSGVWVGFNDFMPDACLINRYVAGTKLSLHQDKDERDYTQPIVSTSLGMPAVFLFGGLKRADKTQRITLTHGDVVVWGGPDRLRYHGVLPLKPGGHPLVGEYRINLTFRKAEGGCRLRYAG